MKDFRTRENLVAHIIADLFPERRSTVITLYSGAFSASASVFVFIKYGFDAGLPWEWACFLLVVLSALMLPVTLFVLPANRFGQEKGGLFTGKEKEVSSVAPCVWGTYTYIGDGPNFHPSRVARDKPWSTLCKKSHGIPSSPRAAAVAKFRLLTGHDCLCAHLFRFNLVTSPICVLCDTGQDMTAAHLDECSALNDVNCIVKRYWRARCLMT
ncbi:solute carrier family 43 member 3 [Trichonephila clavipes]|nr:solute carrier family 43 member 3 [Trichonephila clavipes]